MKMIVRDYTNIFKIEMFNSLLEFVKETEKQYGFKTTKDLKELLKKTIKELKNQK